MRLEAHYLTIRETNTQACLRQILQAAADPSTEARDGGDLSEVDSISRHLSDWFGMGGSPPPATDEELDQLKILADEYERTIAPDQFSEGFPPSVVAQRLRDIAEEIRENRACEPP